MILRLAANAMGTRFEFALAGDDRHELRAIGDEAIEIILDWHRRLSLFDRGSFLSHLNTNAANRPIELDLDCFELMVDCLAVHRNSGGAFDVTVAPLMGAFGFHGEPSGATPADHGPGMEAVELDPRRRTIRFTDHRVALDLGGIAKGHALDAAAAIVREAGVECALLHGGTSTAIAIGAPPGEHGWRIAIRTCGFERVVMLCDRALSVSAPHGRAVVRDGERLGHVIDPRTNVPAKRAMIAAVVGPSARRADAWSTALLVRGDRQAAMPMDYASLIVRPANGGTREVVGGHDADILRPPTESHEESQEEPCVSSTDARS